MSQRRFEPGAVLADKYRLDSLLGEGGMGTVYRATHLLLKAPVAIKVIDREVSSGDVALARFMREAQAAAALRSPHVVQVLDYGSAEGSPFMVMELLEGENLAQRIERVGRLTPGETYRVMSHVARAVAKAHEAGIVHRDLKPDNVFLVHNEGDQLAKVLDFGVAKVDANALGGASHTRTGSLLGTPYYMSPEQAQGNKEVDHRSDLWALAVIAFECLIGRRPFFSDGLGDVVLQICVRDIPRPSSMGEVPPGFDDWFFHATQREPGERFQSARELAEALRDALDIQRDPTGSVPESQWSLAASLPGAALAGAGMGGGASLGTAPPSLVPPLSPEATTERDRVMAGARTMQSSDGPPAPETPIPDEARSHHLVVGERGARWEESVKPGPTEPNSPAANWKVVPVGPSDHPPPAPPKATSDPPAARRRGWGVFLVALAALTLGAALVLVAREYGSDFLTKTLRGETKASGSSAKRSTKTSSGASQRDDEQPTKGDAGETPTKASRDKRSGGSIDHGAAAKDKDVPSEKPGEDDALDALEDDLRTKEEKDDPEPLGADEVGDPPADESPPPVEGPKPEVPEGLVPPPPPPPPADAPVGDPE